MSAAQALSTARAVGIHVEVDGDDLLLEASAPPPSAILEVLSQHKAEIVAVLRPGRDGWSAEDWRSFFDERAAIAEFDGGLSRTEAEARALACCIAEWLNRNPTPSAPGRCAWCGQAESKDAVVLPYGVEPGSHIWLHAECWPAWQDTRRSQAMEALARMGIGDLSDGRIVTGSHPSNEHRIHWLKVLRLIEETMEIDELSENDERLLKKPEIKRDEMGRFEPPNNPTGRRIQRWIGPFKNRPREFIAGVIASRKTRDQQQ